MTLVAQDAGFAIATAGNVFISVWRDPGTLPQLARVRECQQQLVDRSPGGIAVLTVLLDGSFHVGAEEREEAERIARRFAPTTRAHAYVIEGSGFRTAATRAIIAGIQLITRSGHPVKIFSAVADGVSWLVPQAGQAIDAARVTGLVAEARASLDPARRPIVG